MFLVFAQTTTHVRKWELLSTQNIQMLNLMLRNPLHTFQLGTIKSFASPHRSHTF